MSACTHPASAQYTDRARGIVTCTLCGDIVQDQDFQLDPTFARGEKPASRNLRSLGHLRPTRGAIGTRPLSARPSVEAARRGMVTIARQLDISDDMVESAVALYKLAVGTNAVTGARPAILCACLYAVCRRERTSHMIYDFAEAAQESQFEILSYMRIICEDTHTELPVIDPSCMVLRFAEQMNLGTLTGPIVICALKVLRAMRDDWIACGRRPMGICVAALLVACYMFNVSRSPEEVCGFVRLTAGTISKRLDEFAATPTAELLNIDDYKANDVSLPPSFTESSMRSANTGLDDGLRELSAVYYELVAEAKVSTPATPERCAKWRRFIERHCELEGIDLSEENADLTKLSAQRQLEVLGLPNTKPIEPELVLLSMKREEQKILLKSERSASEAVGSSLMGPPTQLAPDNAFDTQRMKDIYQTLITEDPNVMALRHDFDFAMQDERTVPDAMSIDPMPLETNYLSTLSNASAPVSSVLHDAERRLALPWEFIVLQDAELDDSTDIDPYLVLDNEERLRRQKVGEALYKEEWDRGKARTQEEIERLEDARSTRKRARSPIREHATPQDAVARALRGRGASTILTSQIDKLLPGLASQSDPVLEDDWTME